MGTAANQTKLQKCRNRWRNHQKGLEVTYKTVDMGASTMNPPKHRGSRCYIAMERLANPTKTQKCRNRWRNPQKALQVLQKNAEMGKSTINPPRRYRNRCCIPVKHMETGNPTWIQKCKNRWRNPQKGAHPGKKLLK